MKSLKSILAIAFTFLLFNASASPGGKWETIVIHEANYSISFPASPTSTVDQVETELGTLDLNMLILDGAAIGDVNYVYTVNSTSYPGDLINSNNTATLDDFFIGTVEGASNNIDGELLSTKVIDYKGYPGRDISVKYMMEDGQIAIVRMKVYLVNNVSYILQIFTPFEDSNNKSVKKFMNSFKLLN